MRFYKIEQTEEIRDEVRLPARETACRLYDKEKSAQQRIPREEESRTKELPTKYLSRCVWGSQWAAGLCSQLLLGTPCKSFLLSVLLLL